MIELKVIDVDNMADVVLGRQRTEPLRRPRLCGLFSKMAQSLAGTCREIQGVKYDKFVLRG